MLECTHRFNERACAAPCACMSYVTDTFASCLTHPFPSEGDIACENDSSNLYVNPLDGSGASAGGVAGAGGTGGGMSADFSAVRRSASGDGNVLCSKGTQGESSPRGSRASLETTTLPATAHKIGQRPLDASRTSLSQPLEESAAPLPHSFDDSKPKHRKARFQQVCLSWTPVPKSNQRHDTALRSSPRAWSKMYPL